jgi:hypothetical protein
VPRQGVGPASLTPLAKQAAWLILASRQKVIQKQADMRNPGTAANAGRFSNSDGSYFKIDSNFILIL